MKALVTGATGFVGSHLAARLVREGLEVVCAVRRTSRLRWLEGLDVETRVAPLDDAAALAEAARGCDLVFHAAGLTRARSVAAYMEANAEGTRRLLEAVGGEARRLVYVSSLAAVGPTPEPLDEAAEPRPLSGYGASKLAAERLVAAQGGLAWAIVRPPSVYGPRDPNFVTLFRAAQRWGVCPILGGARKALSFVHVADLVEGLWLAGTAAAAAGRTYFVGSGTHTWGEFADALASALGRRVRRVAVPGVVARLLGELGELKWTLTGKPQILCRRKVRDALAAGWTCSWGRAERELGYRPRVGLEAGLRAAAAGYAELGGIGPLGG